MIDRAEIAAVGQERLAHRQMHAAAAAADHVLDLATARLISLRTSVLAAASIRVGAIAHLRLESAPQGVADERE